MLDPHSQTLDRRTVVAGRLRDRDGLLVGTGLGRPAMTCMPLGTIDYLWGAMGAAALVGLGLAQAQPRRTVLVITGDGEQLMGLGGLATIAIAAPANRVIVALDNGHLGETGVQLSHTGRGLDIAAMARAAGFADARAVAAASGVEVAAASFGEPRKGLRFYAVKIKPDNIPPRDAVHIKNRLRVHLGQVAH